MKRHFLNQKNGRRQKFRLLLGIVLPAFLFSCVEKAHEKEQGIENKPNIIYILADDLGYGDLSITGQKKFETPNIDKLAQDGMLFTQHYSGSTVCAPSRSALMTGLHTGHTFIRGNKEIRPEGQYPLDSSVVTVAELLKSAGYVNGAFGKWGLGYPGSEGDPNRQGFDTFYGYNCQRMGHNYYPYHLWENQTKVTLTANEGKKEGTYAPDEIHQKSLEFLERNKDTTFFMYYPSIIPHAELLVPDSLLHKFRGKYLPEKEYVGLDDGPQYRKGPYGSQKESHAAFAAMVYLLDKQVGEIRKKVEDLGIAENTLIIFTSDNGPHQEGGADPDYFNSNGEFKGYKRDLYEGGIRVPMIAYWPNSIKANSISNHISAFWDFLPTVGEIVEVAIPEKVDGISFLPELLGKEQRKHDFLYWEFHERGGKQAVRMGDWKGIRLKMANNPDAPIELYDLSTDPSEEDNVADDNPEMVAQIEQIMKEERTPSEVFRFEFEKLLEQ
ncbi:arylsulfatase [Croceivirga sp. JEA036]|uniref:arylsulfatase n=1 Tax=Croceivirga sp. JEA036 TaxID=2721162 RepID=UPI00143BD786|nr:arylsulfatase [Croceivirga sp. JEA036]NJB35086.1 arylsulfatase [Croceivirga sp. JEA036]